MNRQNRWSSAGAQPALPDAAVADLDGVNKPENDDASIVESVAHRRDAPPHSESGERLGKTEQHASEPMPSMVPPHVLRALGQINAYQGAARSLTL
jgi:hypothetical protein